MTTVQHSRGGERRFVSEDEGAAADWRIADEALAAAARSRLVYVTPWARAGARLAALRARRGPLLAFDCMDLQPGAPLPAELPFVDIAFVPVAGAAEAATVARIAGAGVRIVVALRGRDGSALYEGGRLVSEVAPPSGRVVDTLGAGDALAAAFCIAYLRSGDLPGAHLEAAAYAAQACAHFGGTLGPRGEWDTPLRRRAAAIQDRERGAR